MPYIESNNVVGFHGFPRYWIFLVILHIREQVKQVEENALWSTAGCLVASEGQGAVVEGE